MSAEDESRLSRKRVAEKELTKDNMDAGAEEEDSGPVVATAEELATRKIRKVKRPPGMEIGADKGADSELAKAFGAAVGSKGSGGGESNKATAAIAAGFTAPKASTAPTSGFGSAGFSKQASAPEFGSSNTSGASAGKVTFGFAGGSSATGSSASGASFGFNTAAKPEEPKKEEKKPEAASSFGFGGATKPVSEEKKVSDAAKSASTFGFSFGGAAASAAPKGTSEKSSPLTSKGPGLMEAVAKSSTGSVFGGSSAAPASGEKSSTGDAAAPNFSFKIPDGCQAPDIKPKEEQKLPEEGEVTITTGEEDESTKFVANGKLRERVGDTWAERAKGDMKVNVKADGSGRVIMRDEVTRRAVLNSKIDDGFKVAKVEKNGIVFTAVEEDMKTHTYVLKVPDTASKKGEDAVKELQAAIEANRKK